MQFDIYKGRNADRCPLIEKTISRMVNAAAAFPEGKSEGLLLIRKIHSTTWRRIPEDTILVLVYVPFIVTYCREGFE